MATGTGRAPREIERNGESAELEMSAAPGGAPPSRNGTRALRWAARALISLATLYGAVVLLFFLLQERLVFPASRTLQRAHSELALTHEELDLPTADGETIHARWVGAP